VHGRVIPNLPGDIARMPELLKTWKIAAWKTYTQFNEGWWLDDEKTGLPFLEAVRSSGLKLVCVHKGLPLPPMGDQLQFSRSDDVGRAAKRFKDITFIVYHSGYDDTIKEGPFVPGSGKGGVDSLVQSLIDNGIAPNTNVYAELGTTWRTIMKDPDQTAHVLGKLIKYVGEDRVVWGTDSIWYGSPQDQIQALRTFQISDEFCEKYGYAKLTPQIKAKILGLNAAVPYKIQPKNLQRKASNDALSKWKAAYAEQPDPSFMTFGPKTRGEFVRFWKMGGHT
jgi:predicted TIM-barrel fold metal-dependent hydrolase